MASGSGAGAAAAAAANLNAVRETMDGECPFLPLYLVSPTLPRFRFPQPGLSGGGKPRRTLGPLPAPEGIFEGPPKGPARAVVLMIPSFESCFSALA